MVRRITLCLVAALLALPAVAQNENYVVMRVNDEIATLYDFQDRLVDWVRALRRDSNMSASERQRQIDEAPQAVAREMFDELLMLSRADQLDITIGEVELEEHLTRLKERVGISSDEEFRQALAAQGLTLDAFRASQRRNMTVQRVTGREVYSRIQVEDEEVRRIYRDQKDQYKVAERRQIVELLVPESADTSAALLAERAAEVRAEMVDGRDPEQVAEGKGESVRFIDVGWVGRGDLSAALDDAAWSLAEGEVSPAVEARGGLHILKVVAIEAESVRPFEEVADAIRIEEQTRRLDEEIGSYLSELEDQSFYVVNLPDGARDFKSTSGRVIENGRSMRLRVGKTSSDSP